MSIRISEVVVKWVAEEPRYLDVLVFIDILIVYMKLIIESSHLFVKWNTIDSKWTEHLASTVSHLINL